MHDVKSDGDVHGNHVDWDSYGIFFYQENFNFRSPHRTDNDLAYYVFSDGSVGTGYVVPGGDFSGDHYGVDWDSCGRSSPGLIEHSTAGDATDTAWYINSSGDLNNPDPGMMWEINSIANVKYSYGKFINASI